MRQIGVQAWEEFDTNKTGFVDFEGFSASTREAKI
jgi:hypothetical protein